jgi:fluoroquinolone transport system ATP-binding protein
VLEVRDLTYAYPTSSEPAVSGLTFEVHEGEVFGLLGPSGAGKSTTQGILIGLLKGWQGDVTVMGRALQTWDSSYYEHVGVSFEIPNHFLKLTARENLDYFRSLYASSTCSARDVLAKVGLEDVMDVRVADFSKGMKNRLTFARSILHRPRLLFLDEPTAGLDPVNALIIRDIVRQQQASGTTVVLSTHNMQVADDLCDRVGFIVDGQLPLVEAPDVLKHRYGRRAVRVTLDTGDGVEAREFDLDDLADDADFLDALRHRVHSVHSEETTLEEVFIRVTGSPLA